MRYPDECPVFEVLRWHDDGPGAFVRVGDHVEGAGPDPTNPIQLRAEVDASVEARIANWRKGYEGLWPDGARGVAFYANQLRPLTPAAEAMLELVRA